MLRSAGLQPEDEKMVRRAWMTSQPRLKNNSYGVLFCTYGYPENARRVPGEYPDPLRGGLSTEAMTVYWA